MHYSMCVSHGFVQTEGPDKIIVCSNQQDGTDVVQRRCIENNPESSLSSSESRCESRRRRGRANQRNTSQHRRRLSKSHVSMVKMSPNTVRKRLLTLSPPAFYFEVASIFDHIHKTFMASRIFSCMNM